MGTVMGTGNLEFSPATECTAEKALAKGGNAVWPHGPIAGHLENVDLLAVFLSETNEIAQSGKGEGAF
jgi:hypothetical protein